MDEAMLNTLEIESDLFFSGVDETSIDDLFGFLNLEFTFEDLYDQENLFSVYNCTSDLLKSSLKTCIFVNVDGVLIPKIDNIGLALLLFCKISIFEFLPVSKYSIVINNDRDVFELSYDDGLFFIESVSSVLSDFTQDQIGNLNRFIIDHKICCTKNEILEILIREEFNFTRSIEELVKINVSL